MLLKTRTSHIENGCGDHFPNLAQSIIRLLRAHGVCSDVGVSDGGSDFGVQLQR